jgi:hypothetical protein
MSSSTSNSEKAAAEKKAEGKEAPPKILEDKLVSNARTVMVILIHHCG